jgi:superfamily II DNA or RNA helicase
VFVKQIKHGKILESMCARQGIPAQFYRAAEQGNNLTSRIRKPNGVVIATKILDTGMNSPTLRYALNAAGGRSAIAAEQQSGRVVRRTDAKNHAVFIDIYDKNSKCLSSQVVDRIRKYMELGYQITHIEEAIAQNLPAVSVANAYDLPSTVL